MTLRLRTREQRLPDEHVLDAQYTLDEVQADINTAIDQGYEVHFLLDDGTTLRFQPTDYQVVSVALPTDLKERR